MLEVPFLDEIVMEKSREAAREETQAPEYRDVP